MTDFHKQPLNLTLTPGERWALCKAIVLVSKTQMGTYEPEDLLDDDIFQADEYDDLFKAMNKLNPQMLFQTSDN